MEKASDFSGFQHKRYAVTEMRFTVKCEPHFCVYMLARQNPWALGGHFCPHTLIFQKVPTKMPKTLDAMRV